MARISLLIALFLSVCQLQAQVGIGTTTPNAALEINSSTNGFVLPRVALTATNVSTPVVNPYGGGTPLASTLVYNTATNGSYPTNVIPGYYYWNGTVWVRLNTEASWLLSGNANTNATINFLGTTDNADLVFKRNNIVSGKLTTTNTSFGVDALSGNSVTGTNNVALGTNALRQATSGNSNAAIGFGALESNTVGMQNTAVGGSSLNLNVNGGYNTALGYSAMERNASGNFNTAVGNLSLFNNLSGNGNVAVGKSAMERNSNGANNSALGSYSLFNNQSGSYNIAMGSSALERNVSGSQNVALGASSLYNLQSGTSNVGIGHETQLNGTTTNRNTTLGTQTLFTNTSGNDNTAIGYNAFYSGNYSNATAIGNTAAISADNQIRIGNASVTSIGGFASWTNVSDKRFKKNIIYDKVPGLAFIMQLKPVVYNLDLQNIHKFLNVPQESRNLASEKEKETILQTGFIAQEVEEAANRLGYNFSGVDAPKNKTDYYGLRYAEFVVPLTKAVQEQQTQMERQQAEIQELKGLVKQLLEKK